MVNKEVVIIGCDHHNTLAAIRALGAYYEIKIVVHEDNVLLNKIRVSKSRYAIGNTFVVENSENAIYNWLLSYKKTNSNIILFPCSDLAEYTIDSHSDELSKFYLFPGFCKKYGKVIELMNKWYQYIFVGSVGIKMAKTWKIVKNNKGFQIPQDITFPCIIKPITSCFGHKCDISICKEREYLNQKLFLYESQYTDLLIQEYLDYDYQALACGYLSKSSGFIGTIFRKIREDGKGSTAFGAVVNNTNLSATNSNLIGLLGDMGYNGELDIEYFVMQDGSVYLNEINFRHSGAGCLLIDNGINAPKMLCDELCGLPLVINKAVLPVGTTFMSEIPELVNLKYNKVSFSQWNLDRISSSSFTVFNKKDLGGTYAFYKELLVYLINKRRNR